MTRSYTDPYKQGMVDILLLLGIIAIVFTAGIILGGVLF